MKVSVKCNQYGFSMIELTVAMAVSGIVMLGVLATLNLIYSGNLKHNLLQARNELVNKIRTQSINPTNLVSSAKITSTLGTAGLTPDYGDNSTLSSPDFLKNCHPDIIESSAFGCDKTVIETPGKGYLFYLSDNASLDPEKTIAGEDVYYHSSGSRCSSSEAASPDSCPIFARVWFEPFCLNFATSCNKAMSVAIRYSIGLRSDYTNNAFLAPLEGEFYVPLQKGIQIRNLLSQSDMPILPNSKGIYVIPKYYGFPSQTISGLRFEAIVANPNGLVSMRIQGRSLTGSSAKDFDDSILPAALLAKPWNDVLTPDNNGLGAWAISLTGAVPNQIYNFGTQITNIANSRTIAPNQPTSFPIGSSDSEDPIYHWTLIPGASALTPPTFKSGFYQFRIVANDVLGGEVTSSNYISVRLISTPEFKFSNTDFNIDRDCGSSAKSYSVFIADDEALKSGQVSMNNGVLNSTFTTNTTGTLNFTFSADQPAGDYPVILTLKNNFSDLQLETLLVPKAEYTKVISLSEVDVSVGSGLLANPAKIMETQTGKVTLNYTTGSCCNAVPQVNWTYLDYDYNTLDTPLLSGPASSNMSCTLTGNTRSCTNTITATALREGPLSSDIPNISAQLDLGAASTNLACQLSPPPAGNPITKYIPTIKLPNIGFLLSESIWLDLPPGTPTGAIPSLKAYQPRVVVRIDFATPLGKDIVVDVVNAANPTQIFCPNLTFVGSAIVGPPIDLFCNTIPATFSGQLMLKFKSGDQSVFKMDNLKKSHRICQAKITSISSLNLPATKTLLTTYPMFDSPYGLAQDGTQDLKNDTGKWTAGAAKKLRCYDTWQANQNADNVQDYYNTFIYNTETIVNTSLPPKNQTLWAGFSKFVMPNNPPISIDSTAGNIPYLFSVIYDGDEGNVIWRYNETINGLVQSISTKPQFWENITDKACGQMQKVKLLRTPLTVVTNSSGIIMKSATQFAFKDLKGTYSYYFMCGYGHWHPSGKAYYTNWLD